MSGLEKSLVAMFIVVSLIYSMFIFQSGANISNISMKNYSISLVNFLGGEVTEEFHDIEKMDPPYSNAIYGIIDVSSYIVHPQWIASKSFSISQKTGEFNLYAIKSLLYKFKFIEEPPRPYVFSGVFITLPGAILYDYNYLGYFTFCIYLGVLFGIILLLLELRYVYSATSLGIIILLIITLCMSPIIPAYSFVYFNYTFISFFCIDVITMVLFGRSSWLIIDS